MSRVPMSLFHAAAEREKEDAKQLHVEIIKHQSNTFKTAEKIQSDEAKEEE